MRKFIYILFFPLVVGCKTYRVEVMKLPDNTTSEICDDVEYIRTENLVVWKKLVGREGGVSKFEKTTKNDPNKISFPPEKEDPREFTYTRLLTKVRKEQKDNEVLLTNLKWDIKEIHFFFWKIWERPYGVTYDIVKCKNVKQ